MKTGQELLLIAAEKEYNRLCKRAEKAKAEADEYVEIGTEAVAIHNDLRSVIDSDMDPKAKIDELARLEERRNHVNRVLKKDASKLFDKQIDAEYERDELGREIQMMKFRMQRSA